MRGEQGPEEDAASAERRLALLAVAPARRAFAVECARGISNVSKAARELRLSRGTIYKWSQDRQVRAYVAMVLGVTADNAHDLLPGQVEGAIETLSWAMRSPDATPTNLRAAELTLALVGISKEAALPKYAPPPADPVVNVTLHVPTNPRTAAIQAERRRLREQLSLEAEFEGPAPA